MRPSDILLAHGCKDELVLAEDRSTIDRQSHLRIGVQLGSRKLET